MSLSFLAAGVVLMICYHNAILTQPALHPHAEAIHPIALHNSLALLTLTILYRVQIPVPILAFSRILNNRGTRTAKVRRYGDTPGQEWRL